MTHALRNLIKMEREYQSLGKNLQSLCDKAKQDAACTIVDKIVHKIKNNKHKMYKIAKTGGSRYVFYVTIPGMDVQKLNELESTIAGRISSMDLNVRLLESAKEGMFQVIIFW